MKWLKKLLAKVKLERLVKDAAVLLLVYAQVFLKSELGEALPEGGVAIPYRGFYLVVLPQVEGVSHPPAGYDITVKVGKFKHRGVTFVVYLCWKDE